MLGKKGFIARAYHRALNKLVSDAAYEGNVDRIRTLVRFFGADINADSGAALNNAVAAGRYECIAPMVKMKANPFLVDDGLLLEMASRSTEKRVQTQLPPSRNYKRTVEEVFRTRGILLERQNGQTYPCKCKPGQPENGPQLGLPIRVYRNMTEQQKEQLFAARERNAMMRLGCGAC